MKHGSCFHQILIVKKSTLPEQKLRTRRRTKIDINKMQPQIKKEITLVGAIIDVGWAGIFIFFTDNIPSLWTDFSLFSQNEVHPG